MLTIIAAMAAVFVIIYVVPLVVYGVASALGGLRLPTEASPVRFLLGVGITKLGTAVVFVWLLELCGASLTSGWFLYGLLWFVMFAASEVGDVLSGRSTWREASLGILSEAIYAPASAFTAWRILNLR